jgi:hypothetical protein
MFIFEEDTLRSSDLLTIPMLGDAHKKGQLSECGRDIEAKL